jgi:hypothetical protein
VPPAAAVDGRCDSGATPTESAIAPPTSSATRHLAPRRSHRDHPTGGIVVYGRSDATLNPGGVRIGTAEIYRPLEAIAEVVEGLAVGKREDDDEVIWLFLVLKPA